MPVLRKRNHWHGLALECLAGLEPASLRYATQRDTSYTIGTISRDCGLSVVTRGEFTQRFRLSQAYGYIVPHFLAPKLAKFQKKKRPLLAARFIPIHSINSRSSTQCSSPSESLYPFSIVLGSIMISSRSAR